LQNRNIIIISIISRQKLISREFSKNLRKSSSNKRILKLITLYYNIIK